MAVQERGSPAVAIIGVGNMGGAMAERLLSLGWRVGVHDVEAKKQQFLDRKCAQTLANSACAAMHFVAIIICVVDAAQTEEVLFGQYGVVNGVVQGQQVSELRSHTVLLCPTIAPADTERFAARLAEHGIACIDAPMSGGPARARAGSMSLMLAGPDALLQQHAALLQALSSHCFHVSQRVGDGARTKLVNNLLAGINLVGAAECLALAERMGLDLPTTQRVIEQSSGQSWIGTDRMQRVLANGGVGDYAARAHMGLLAKDTRLAVEAAQASAYAGPLGAHAAAVFAQALAAGFADEDDAALFKLLRTRGAA